MVLGWVFGVVGCHVTNKGAELSYNLCYLLAVAFLLPFRPVRPVCPYHQGLSVPISKVYLHLPHYELPSL